MSNDPLKDQSQLDLPHDIKNHLAVILSYANLLELWAKGDVSNKEKFEKCIEVIKKRVEVLTQLADQIPRNPKS